MIKTNARNVLSLTALALIVTGGVLIAGPLNPPAGPVTSTYKTLAEVEPRRAVNATNTPGSATAVYRISQPGSYYLTGNIAGVNAKNGIEIVVSGVTLDLGGFDLEGAGGSLDGVGTIGGSLTNIVVCNGSVRGWGGDGVDLGTDFEPNCRVSDIRASGNGGFGVKVGNGFIMDRCNAYGNGQGGLSAGNQGTATLCEAISNGGGGIFLGQGSTISNSVASFNFSGDGINSGGYCTIVNCMCSSNPGAGINSGPVTTISGCTVNLNQGHGLNTGNGSTITDCSVNFNQAFGILTANGCTISGCTVQYSNLGGIECSAQCVIRGNTCSSNANGSATGFNIHVTGTDNRIEGNCCTTAVRGIDADVAGNIIIRNTCSGNSTNWDIAAGNVCLVVQGVTSAAILGNSGGVAPGSTDPNANFTY